MRKKVNAPIYEWIGVNDLNPEDCKNIRFKRERGIDFATVLCIDAGGKFEVKNRYRELGDTCFKWSLGITPKYWIPIPEFNMRL